MDLDLELFDVSSVDGHTGNAWYAQQARANGPVRQRAKFCEGPDIGGETEYQGQARSPGQRRHDGRLRALRHLARCFSKAFAHHLPGAVDVGLVFEQRRDHREALNGLRTN